LAERLVRDDVRGAFICGTTGEFSSLSVDERMHIAQRWRDVAGEKLKLVVHVGHTSLPDCQALASHAQAIGADAISAIGPYFFRPSTLDDLVEYSRVVASAAPGVPFYYYHLPQLSGVEYSMMAYLERAGQRVPTLGGVKFSEINLEEYGRCIQHYGDQFNLPFGSDQILLAALALGAPGAVGSTYSFMAPVYHRVIEAFHQGEIPTARRQQARSMDVIQVLFRYGIFAALKACMKLAGVDCGPVRLPLRSLSEEQYHSMRTDLESVGFFHCLSE
jgi:N-acetylneuraminate lyase